MTQAKINRKHEKKMKENLIMLDDERRHADQYKEQAEKVKNWVARQFCSRAKFKRENYKLGSRYRYNTDTELLRAAFRKCVGRNIQIPDFFFLDQQPSQGLETSVGRDRGGDLPREGPAPKDPARTGRFDCRERG